jgi:hypothetical protein
MADRPPKGSLDYEQARIPQQGYRLLLLTWVGPMSFVLSYVIAGVIAASGGPRVVVGGFLVCAALGPLIGLGSSIVGVAHRAKGLAAIMIGMALNAIIFGVFLLLACRTFLQSL